MLYRAIAAGELPHVVIAGVKHVDAEAFEAWVEGRRKPATAEAEAVA